MHKEHSRLFDDDPMHDMLMGCGATKRWGYGILLETQEKALTGFLFNQILPRGINGLIGAISRC